MFSSIHACFALLYLLFFAISLSATEFITGARSAPRLSIGAVFACASTYFHFHNARLACYSAASLCVFLLLLTFAAFRISASKIAIRRLRHMFIATTLVGLLWSTANIFCCLNLFTNFNSIKAADQENEKRQAAQHLVQVRLANLCGKVQGEWLLRRDKARGLR